MRVGAGEDPPYNISYLLMEVPPKSVQLSRRLPGAGTDRQTPFFLSKYYNFTISYALS